MLIFNNNYIFWHGRWLTWSSTEKGTAQDVSTLNLWKILNLLQLEICDKIYRRRFLSANSASYLELEQEQGLIFPLRSKVEL